MPKALFNW